MYILLNLDSILISIINLFMIKKDNIYLFSFIIIYFYHNL